LKRFVIGFEVVIGHLMCVCVCVCDNFRAIYNHKKERNKRQISGEPTPNIKISKNIKKIKNKI